MPKFFLNFPIDLYRTYQFLLLILNWAQIGHSRFREKFISALFYGGFAMGQETGHDPATLRSTI